MRILFICLHWHSKSNSAKWFLDLLRDFAEVIEVPYDFSIVGIRDLAESSPDLVICWQTEYLVPYFLSLGLPAIAVPMADGSSNYSNYYFKSVGILGSISTSNFIANRFSLVGKQSYRLKYFPSLSEMGVVESENTPSSRDIMFFSTYRSKVHEETNRLSLFLEKEEFGRFHRHLVLDEYTDQVPYDLNVNSSYFVDIKELNNLLKRTTYFITPRNSEGIGLSTLRAMAFGCIPIAVDGVGNAEYFPNNKLGVVVPMKYFQKTHSPEDIFYIRKILRNQLDLYSPEERRASIYSWLNEGRVDYLNQSKGLKFYLNSVIDRHKLHARKFTNRSILNKILISSRFQFIFRRLGI